MKINRTILRANQILQLVSSYPDGLTLSEIVNELKMPKASAHDIIKTLCATQMLRETGKRYAIGLTSKEIGDSYSQERDIYGIAKPLLVKLADKQKLTASLAHLNNARLEYLIQYTCCGTVQAVGVSDGFDCLHAFASAKALVAYLPPARQEKLLSMLPYKRFTSRTISSRAAYEKELKNVLKQGFAIDAGEFNEYLHCVSVPVLLKGRALATATLSGIRIDKNRAKDLSLELLDISHKISHKLTSNIKV